MNKVLHKKITKSFGDLTPKKINNGHCFCWAWVAYQLCPGAVLFTVDNHGGHAFVKDRELFYDAEHPLGVSDWNMLSFFKELDLDGVKADIQDERAFVRFWKKEGACSMNLDALEEQVKAIQRELCFEELPQLRRVVLRRMDECMT